MTSPYWSILVSHTFERNQPMPPDRATARAAAFELRGRGLTPRDIASALGIGEAAVRALLESQGGRR